jgi:septal ring factor EnvC (AmiA/AmiB activator)
VGVSQLRKKLAEAETELEILRVGLKAREAELEELRREVRELHASISYRVGRWIAETWWGARLKSFLRKYVFK